MNNAAYCYDFPEFIERYGPALCVSAKPGQPHPEPVFGIRTDWVFSGYNYQQEQQYGTRRLDLTSAADMELARTYWNRARYWAADNNKKMPLSLFPY